MTEPVIEKIAQPIVAKTAPVETKPEGKPDAKTNDPKFESKPELTPEEVEELILNNDYLTSPLFYDVANYFNIDSHDYDEAKGKLGEITEWAIRNCKSNKTGDVLLEFKKIEGRLGAPALGEKRYKSVYRYVKLVFQKQSLEKEISAFERSE